MDDLDRRHLLDSIVRADERWDWQWLSYALMSSHVHYGLIAGARSPGGFFRSAHTRYAKQYHSRRAGQTLGPVFANRPTIHPVGPSELGRLVAYHHRNPVSAGVVERPEQSTWTSHRAYLRLAPAPVWLDVERALDLLGFEDCAAGRRRFGEFVMDLDLGDRQWEPRGGSHALVVVDQRENVDWHRLIRVAREVTGLTDQVPLASKERRAVRTRLLVAVMAVRDRRVAHAEVAEQLGMSLSGVYKLLQRSRGVDGLERVLTDARSRLDEER